MNLPMESGDWSYPFGLFDVVGIELEYMIVDRATLDVRPVCDGLFRLATGESTSEVEPDGPEGRVSWSNELTLHVVELKTQRPVPTLDHLADDFQAGVNRINGLLDSLGCRLLPTAMHPWMDPARETKLWPHECNEIYRTYDRIFGCRGHGWGNLQSTHINLPFANDDEFGRLHAALRLVLPLLPALAASSPIADGTYAPHACYRMEVYRANSLRVPMMAGLVVPEPVFTRHGYEHDILGKLYDDLRPYDPDCVLRYEFANARGAMARFDRGAIEIRVLDIQECPLADMAIAALIVEVVRALVDQRWSDYASQQAVSTEALYAVLLETIRDAERAEIREPCLLNAFGIEQPPCPALELWRILLDQVMPNHATWTPMLRRLIDAGTLATRIRRSLPPAPTHADLHKCYAELADCLTRGELFRVP